MEDLRDKFAIEFLREFLSKQGKRRVSPINRFLFWLGFETRSDFDYNIPQIVRRSYGCADEMLKARESNKSYFDGFKILFKEGWKVWNKESPNSEENLKKYDFLSYGTMLLYKEKIN